MSTFRIDLAEIREVSKHPNADRLDVVKVFDWSVVTQKDKYKVGDQVIYIPVDTLLTQDFENILFPPDSKITLDRHRIKSIKIRKQISQGMIVNPSEFTLDYVRLNTSKYEPPVSSTPRHMQLQPKKNKPEIKAFKKYTDIENYKYYDRSFQDGEMVYISEKLHGTSARYGWFKSEANVWYQKLLKFFRLLPEWTFAYGSRNVQIQAKLFKKHQGFQSEAQGVNFDDVYTKIVYQYDLKKKIPKGWAVYGEIVGDGIQRNYTYGCKENEHKFYAYDIMIDGRYLDYHNFTEACEFLGLTPVPSLYVGPHHPTMVEKYRSGDSTIEGQKVREGVVIKPLEETTTPALGRKVLKAINDDYYLLKDNTDFH